MTVSSSTARADYNGNGVTVDFAVPFRFLLETDLQVLRTVAGISTTLILNSLGADGYSVVGAGQPSGGTITTVTAPALGQTLTILRAVSRTQLTDYIPNDPFPAESHERALDKLTMIVQEQDEVITRAIVLPPGVPGLSTNLPLPASLQGFRWNAAANGIENYVISPFTAPAGSSNVGFLQAGIGAVPRTLQDKGRERVSVMDFGAVGDGVADDTSAIQLALDSGAKNIHFPKPSVAYLISAALNVSNSGITVYGDNYNNTIVRQGTAAAGIFNVTAARFTIRDMRLDYTGVTPVAGAVAISISSTDARVSCVLIASCYTGIFTTAGSGLMCDSLQVQNYVYAGVHCQTVNDVYCAKFIFNAGNATNGAGGGIRLEEKVEAAVFTDGDILNGVYSMVCTSAVNNVGVRPAYNNFTNVYFDSATAGVLLTNLVETEFVGCWFSGGRAGGGSPGCTVNVSDSVNFVASRFFNCGGHGCQVNSGAVRTTFVACSFESNSITAGAGVSHGLIFGNNAADWSVIGGKAHNGLFSGQQGYGIFISAGCDRFSVRDVQVGGNATGGILDGSTATVRTISGNSGYVSQAKGATNVAIGQTVATVTHGLAATPAAEDIIITPTTLMSAAGITSWRVTGISATQFQLQTNAVVAGAAFTFSWKVRIKGD